MGLSSSSRSQPRRFTIKIDVVVDAQGLPIRLGPAAGQTDDRQTTDILLDYLGPRRLYRERSFIERVFAKLKHFRHIATRHDRFGPDIRP